MKKCSCGGEAKKSIVDLVVIPLVLFFGGSLLFGMGSRAIVGVWLGVAIAWAIGAKPKCKKCGKRVK